MRSGSATRSESSPKSRAAHYEVVHVEASDAVIQDGPHVPAETSRRIMCDAGRVVMTHDSDGNVLDVGRRTRTVPPAIRRALDHRDSAGCRFPGCDARFCDAHHVQHWTDGGANRLDNLVLLCRFHHRAVHEGGFKIQVSASGSVTVTDPSGRPMTDAPPLPALQQDPVVALRGAHAALGLEIDEWTATPDRDGNRLDLDQVLRALLRHNERVSAETRKASSWH